MDAKMKRLAYLSVLICLFLVVCGNGPQAWAASPRDEAIAAYHQVEGNVFSYKEIRSAIMKMEDAFRRDPNEPAVFAARSLAVLVAGYTKGDWYETDTFQKGFVEKSLQLAEYGYGLKNAKTCILTTCHLARVFILTKDFGKAQALIDKARELEPENFYPWYFQGILFEKLGQFDAAKKNFDKAERLSAFEYHHSIVNSHRKNVARWEQNPQELERLHLDDIRRNPDSPHAHGNYGAFLMRRHRLSEAEEELEKAISIHPYPLAEHHLKEVREMMHHTD